MQKLFPAISSPYKAVFNARYAAWVLVYVLFLAATGFIAAQLHIEPFERIAELLPFIIVAFLLHSFINIRFRPAVLMLTFIACCYYAFGLVSGSVLLVLLFVFFVFLHAPIPHLSKWVLLIAILFALGLVRYGHWFMPRFEMIVPYLAALIMFRSIIWMYEAKHHPMNENIWLRLSYFFCIPNLAFLFFPIVDYRTYVNSYYNVEAPVIWRKGAVYVFLGIMQFVLYRVLHNLIAVSGSEVYDVFTLAEWIVVNYFSLLKISGTLTAAAGFLCFFGFNLPSPFGNYFFAESFAEYWRKVNIYWRDFMMKIVYYPSYFILRKKSKYAAEVSIFIVFSVSVFFHWYQKFWITGLYTLRWNDFFFWLGLAVLINLNSRFDTWFGKKKTKSNFLGNHLGIAVRTALVFAVMAVLILLWNCNSWSETRFIFTKAFGANSCATQVVIVAVLLFAAHLGFSMLSALVSKQLNTENKSVGLSLAGFSFVLLLSAFIYWQGENTTLFRVIAAENKTQGEVEKEEADYYESIFKASVSKWETNIVRHIPGKAFDGITNKTGDILMRTLRPSSTSIQDGYLITTNSFGMRDKEYSLSKPDSVYRAVLLGTSYEMGSGVDDSCVFENISEGEINRGGEPLELLNLSMGLYTSAQHVYLADTKMEAFHPDAAFVFVHTAELQRFPNFFSRYIRAGVDLNYPFLKAIKERAGVNQSQSVLEIKERLAPFGDEMVQWCYDTIVTMCKAKNIEPIWFFVPTTKDELTDEMYNKEKGMADKAGFICYSLADAFKGYQPKEIQVSDVDSHPNCLAHHLLSQKFSNILQHEILKQWKEKHLRTK